MSEIIEGFAFSGLRSYVGDLQFAAPLAKVNLFAGQNNAGKSTILNFASDRLCGPALNSRPTGLDVPQPVAEGWQYRFAVAFRLDENEMRVALDTEMRLLDSLLAFFAQPCFHLTGEDDLLWYEYATQDASQNVADLSRDQAAKASQASNLQELARAVASAYSESSTSNALHVMGKFDPLRKPRPEAKKVTSFRQITLEAAPKNANEVDGKGIIGDLAQLESPLAVNAAQRLRFDAVNRFVQTVLDDYSVTLQIPHDRSTINVIRNGVPLPLENLGTGLHQVIMIAVAATVNARTVMCIEEPEIHLHPLFQRKLLQYLRDETDNQYLIATHSAHMLDYERCNVFHVQLASTGSTIERAMVPSRVSELCVDLGYRPSDLLQANAVVWVEGPSDRIYLRHWLNMLAPEFIEGIHYSIMFYGGALLNHLSGNDPDPLVERFISLRLLNRRIVIMIDSDKKSSKTPLNKSKRRVRDEFDAPGYPGFAWVTDGYTIENYVPPETLKAAVAKVHPKAIFTWGGDPWENPLPELRQSSSAKTIKPDKTSIAHAVCEMWEVGALSRSLKKRVLMVGEFIREANGGTQF